MIEFRTRDVGEITVVDAAGRLDLVSATLFREVIATGVARGARLFVVDLAEVVFVDSSGLGSLVAGLKLARRVGGDLRICATSEQVDLVLDLTGLGRVLHPYREVTGAIASF
jgi:anti-sigma B factor antagonist